MDYTKHYKICVSGAAALDPCSPNAKKLAIEVGRQIVEQKAIILTGATTGIPYWSAVGAKQAGGISIGFSPATTEKEHIKVYHLPVDAFDLIIYTGSGYAGRNLLLTRAADAVVTICGRMGTLNEFTIAFEDKKPIGVLEGTGGTADKIDFLLKGGYRGPKRVIGSSNPEALVKTLIKMVKEQKDSNHKTKKGRSKTKKKS
ncbi:MAG: hypothetical protein A2842_00620 [Candidatus Wildermuthbacteria bacterium RIFCSPHIGHO2_01_FULL_48_25]|uniref:Protein containing YHS domain protein n=1 Tax=Candidatus Wildermuthbacteria bacterium RIFCSPLOWO2_01_FULL_48_16 TaxID=1802461 RepID=A0A1G2RJP5_9BACT|nr:MAG: hypothetical protein A2842_00620 [Candidatus Wildermuthbacteria bacterium RIFCSPHIGHO2_01_FULL_48_25]OHA68436.1 MAG: hypothetical protein A3J57_01090 [Candidatus Wildermuthbacteria bacterium RIFCSPHIGHO2_02_FULL_49_12b]OHA73056.1 MAG: hypothetical protein A3B24_01430 [Candidatus Wildermuthbacteria bacterium RIFCSPLOWO2_01_FULL_48_16]